MLITVLPFARAEQPEDTDPPEATEEPYDIEDPFPDVKTPYICLVETETGAVLYSRNADKKAYPASTTKIMTALLCCEILPDLNKVVTLGWRPVVGFGPTSSLMGLEAYEEISLIDLLYGMLLISGNDAAKALAMEAAFEYYGDATSAPTAVDMFVDLMNKKAEELGMTNTHFATIDGRHSDDHYTTAADFSILMREVIKNRILVQVMGTATYRVAPTNKHPGGFSLQNSNRLICKNDGDTNDLTYSNCFAGKTGQTNEAGYCLVSAAASQDVRLVLVQFGDDSVNGTSSSSYRFETAKRLYEWGFRNYRDFALSEFGLQTQFELTAENASPLDAQGGRFIAEAKIDGLSVTGAYSNLKPYFDDPSRVRAEVSAAYVNAPIRKGDVIGYVDYHFGSDTVVRATLVSARDVASASDSTPEPHETAFISNTPPPGSGKNSNLEMQRSPGVDQYSVWIYYDNSLYTMNSTEWHYLYLTDGLFRAAARYDSIGRVELYRRYFDSNDTAYYVKTDFVTDGAEYAIVIDGSALTAASREGTLTGIPVHEGSSGIITDGITDSMIWRFENHSNGYYITNGSKYLMRSAGSGILFWVLIVVILLIALIVIRLIVTRKNRRNRIRRRGAYRSWR